jgi:hypothetical protein
MKRDTRAAFRFRTAETERGVDEAMRLVAEMHAKDAADNAAAYAERTKPVPFTDDELKSARVVRTRFGWASVARVNEKTVTINGAFGEDRLPMSAILEVKS